MTKIAIIGGGASGLACAIEIMRTVKNKDDVKVTILERLPRVGKKILVTGNGRCNLTNVNASVKNYRGDADFTEYALNQYPPQSNIVFFNSLGLYTRTEDEGRVYPLSNQASSVLDALRFECARLGVETVCDYRAVHLKTVYTGVTTKIIVNNRDRFDYVVVACGGMACKAHGTDGDAYDLLKMFGHKIISPAPALVSLNCDEFTKALKGVRSICKMNLIIDGEKTLENYGEVQFTDYGLSGIPIMQLSRFVSVSPSNNIYIELDTTPDFTAEEIREYLYSRRNIDKGLCENMLSGIMNKQLCIVLMKECDIQVNGRINELTDSEIEKLADIIKCWKIKIKNSRSFDYAQVTAGGADCSQFNAETMESSLVPNVFCCGEALNIDGDCGGYNLQWAWSSGRLAGNTIAERINNAQN
ncbi:MAG: aminoacetone oxidase family FAD-binding enzyme [Ruminococcaceae bacterium]|nr:aminoacetone oxidase family FAD-binding enzyme [Oscillospiraceae bacterium]